MLYATREDVPAHVPKSRIVDHDIFSADAPDGDFAAAMVRLRDSGVPELFWTPRNGGHWVATREPLIRRILEDTEHFSSRAMRVPKEANPVPPMIPLMLDPPEHHKYRRLIAPAMTPAAVRRLEERVRALTIRLIEELEPKGGCDFIADFSQQMPIAIFLGLLELPEQDRPRILAIVHRITRPDVPETRMKGFADLGAYSMAKIRERREAPGEDLISSLVKAEVDGKPLDDAQLQGLMTVLFLAGLDTVAGMLGFITRFLATSPAHRQELRDHPERVDDAVDEFLRRMAMVNLCREVNRDTELGGVALKRGELVIAPTALCNFPQDGQDWLSVDFRRPKPRLHDATFGIGPHYCVGARLAHAEIRIFLEEWVTRIPDFAIPEGTRLEVRIGAAVTLASLPLAWTPRGRA